MRPVNIDAPDSPEVLTLAEKTFDREFTETELYKAGWRLAGQHEAIMLDGKFLKKYWSNTGENHDKDSEDNYEQMAPIKSSAHLTVVK